MVMALENRDLLSGNKAAAWGARLARAEVIPNFPITPQTEIIEVIAQWIADGEMDAEFLRTESEHSAMSACLGAQAAGVRSFTATSSQGLLYMHELLYIASGLRLPIVMVNVSRALSAPITLWSDFNDILDQRDAGWIIFFAQNNQELLDTIIQAYKIAEDERVLLPVIVNMEGFIHSFTREPVLIPDQSKVDSFLPKYKPVTSLCSKKPMTLGAIVFDEYMYFRRQLHLAQRNALKVMKKADSDWRKQFGRSYGIIDCYELGDAKICLVTAGSESMTAKFVVKKLRERGKKVGLLRIRAFRPWPEEELKSALEDVQAIAVADRDISPGSGGILHSEIRSTLYGSGREKALNSFIIGLGGRPIHARDFEYMIKQTEKDASAKRSRVEWIGGMNIE